MPKENETLVNPDYEKGAALALSLMKTQAQIDKLTSEITNVQVALVEQHLQGTQITNNTRDLLIADLIRKDAIAIDDVSKEVQKDVQRTLGLLESV